MKRLSSIIIALLLPILALQAEQANDSLLTDTTTVKESEPRKENVFKRMFRKFTDIDENYIEPQRYLFTGMLQATYTYDIYTLRCDDTHSCPRLFTGRCGNGPWRREQCVRQARFIGGAKMS